MLFCKNRLRLAKDLRGLNNPAFAELLGCSVSKVKLLLDIEVPISQEDQNLIASKLKLPLSFFSKEEFSAIPSDEIFYRSVARLKAQYKKTNEAYTALAKQINSYFEKNLKLPTFEIPDLGDTDPNNPDISEHTSLLLRAKWGLGILPINNIVSLMELKGIRVFRLPLEVKQIDALSFFDQDTATPYIFLNTHKSPERMRFDAAHELGHMILHRHDYLNKDNRDKESEADRFSSEFLMPKESFIAYKPSYLSLENMIEYKKKWRTSLASLNYKFHKLNYITEWVYRSNCIKINSLGYHINEPHETHRDESLMFTRILSVLAAQPNFSKTRMLDEIGISEDDFNELTFDSLNSITKPKPILRVLD